MKVFADAGDLDTIRRVASDPIVCGFTTNATLMRNAGVTDYQRFARELLAIAGDRPVSLPVVDERVEVMVQQARRIASWGEHVYVKLPITTSAGRRCDEVIRQVATEGVQINVTAVTTLSQARGLLDLLAEAPAACVSILAGRIADTGRDPVPIMAAAAELLAVAPRVEVLWGSAREVINVMQAAATRCHIITLAPPLVAKLELLGHDLDGLAADTVQMFRRDAQAAGLVV